MGAGDDEVGVGDVPLAPIVRLVAAGAEPVAQGRHRVRVQPPHPGVGVLLGDPVGLRGAVQRRVLPGEQRRPARQARRRPRIVTMEVQTTPAKRLAGREAVAAKRCDGLGLIRRWVPLLVRHDDENVRRAHARRLVSLTVCDAGTERGLSGLWCLAGRRHRAGAGRRGAPALREVPSQTRRPVQVRGLGPRVSDARLAITAVRTSSTRSRAPAKPAPRLNPPRPYLRAALARRPRPGRSGKSRPWTARSPRVGSSLPARGLLARRRGHQCCRGRRKRRPCHRYAPARKGPSYNHSCSQAERPVP